MNIVVKGRPGNYSADWGAGPRTCALGRSGIAIKQREGDGITPVGLWPLRCVFYRADRLAHPPRTILPVTAITQVDAWCDVADDPHYNRLVRLPHGSLDERLWREDGLYDVVVIVGYNDAPVVPGRGSAIFLHVAREDYGPTAGCVALARADLLEALAQLGPGDGLVIEA